MTDPSHGLEAPLSAAELMRFLPHRPPFFFLKQLVEWFPGRRAVSHVEFDGDEFFFRGHFPGRPIVPGVILVEAAAQTGGLALAMSFDDAPIGDKMPALAKIREMRFRAPARPKELLVVDATVTTRFGPLGVVEVTIRRGETTIAEGNLAIGLASQPD